MARNYNSKSLWRKEAQWQSRHHERRQLIRGAPPGGGGSPGSRWPSASPPRWALRFGNGVLGDPTDLIFSAGIVDETHGLLGIIEASD